VISCEDDAVDRNPKIPLRSPLAFSTHRGPGNALHITLYDPTALKPYASKLHGVDTLIRDYMAPAILGWMALWPGGHYFRKVAFVSARPGYGPTVYELAFEIARRLGFRVMPGEELSDAAQTVWRRFAERADVRMEELPPDLKIYDVEYLDAGAAMAVPLRGFDAAWRRGQDFVRKLQRESGLSRDFVLEGISDAGDRLYELMQQESNPVIAAEHGGRRGNPDESIGATKSRLLAARARRNPADHMAAKARMLSWNPLPALPVSKRGMVPQMILGSIGTKAVYAYRGWDIEVGPYGTGAWAAAMKKPGPDPDDALASSTTFDGAVCAAKITVDYVATRNELEKTGESGHFIRMWDEIFQYAQRMVEVGYRPTRANVARAMERNRIEARRRGYLQEFAAAYAWWDSLPLTQRVQLIDDVLALFYCRWGTDPSKW